MDDAHTQRTLDALADLYLTGDDAPASPVTPRSSAGATSADTSRASDPRSSTPRVGPSVVPNQHQPHNQLKQSTNHSAANTGPRDSAPLRLPPKLRIRHTPAPAAATITVAPGSTTTSTWTSTSSSAPPAANGAGPARPWREVRQERREAQAVNDQHFDNAITSEIANSRSNDVTSDAPNQRTVDMDKLVKDMMRQTPESVAQDKQPKAAGDEHGALADHMHEARESHDAPEHATPEHQTPGHAAPDHAAPNYDVAGDVADDELNDQHTDHTQGRDDDHSPYVFPTSASRSSNIAASGVMTDEADGPMARGVSLTLTSQAVYLGNLPGFAGPWLAQYAQLLAVKNQRVAIVHMTQDVAEVQLVSPLGVEQVETAQDGETIIDLFERLTHDSDCPLTQWLVHLPMPLTQASIELGHDFDSWTLLSGADDMAVAGGFQWLERMLEHDRRKAFRQVGVSVMGSDPSRGQAVADKLTAASDDALSGPVLLRASRRQMAPVNIQSIGVFAPAMEMWAEFVAYLTSMEDVAVYGVGATDAADAADADAPDVWSVEGATPQATASSRQDRARLTTTTAAATGSENFSIPDSRRVSPQRQSPAQLKASQLAQTPAVTPSLPEFTQPQVVSAADSTFADIAMETPAAAGASAGSASSKSSATTTTTAPASTTAQTSSAVMDSAGASAVDDSHESKHSLASLDLVRWITPGAIALEARCPTMPAVQLALDQQGRVHVMTANDNAREAAITLLEVQAWAVEHLAVLRLTQRQCRFDMDAQPVVHLFATDGIAAASMTRTLNASLKLHLLQQAHIGSQSTWVASPLN